MKKPCYTLLYLFLFPFYIYAQSDAGIFYTGPLKISQKEKGKDVTYNFEGNNFVSFKNDSVVVSPNKYKYSVYIGDMNNICYVKGISVPTILICSAIGFILGFGSTGMDFGGGHDVSSGERFVGGLAGGVVFGLIGGIISVIFYHDTYCYLNEGDIGEKKIRLIKALNDNKK